MQQYFRAENKPIKNNYKNIRKRQYISTQRNDAMSKSEINNMFQKCNNPEIKGIMAVMLMTGSRISEVLMLKGKDISTDDKHIIFNSYVLKKRNGVERLIKKVHKTHEYFHYFKEYVNSRHLREENFIFQTSRHYVWKAIKALNPETTTHLFRHTVATMLGEHLDIFTMQKWMGWSNLNMAVRYVHPKNIIAAGTNAMDKIF